MEGFFTKKQTSSNTRPDGKVYSCVSCGLYKNAKTPKMQAFGNFKKGILNIGGITNEVEDIRGKPWQGSTGRILQATYKELGIDLFEDCLNINAINCYTKNPKFNVAYSITCCRKFILQAINKHKPKVIILFGQYAVNSLIGYRWKKGIGELSKWRGWTIPDQNFNTWICPVFYPEVITKDKPEITTIWKQDLKQALKKRKEPLLQYKEPTIKYISDLSVLRAIKKPLISFDYETTGIKPQAKGHRIICISVAISENRCFVFLLPPTRKERKPFLDLLANPEIGKMAHNMKYEENWSVTRLKQPIQNWHWDSMIASHLLDNRVGITGLKFQTYIQFGIIDYSSEVDPYIHTTSKNGNKINRIEELLKLPDGKKQLLKYCALDSIYEFRLAMLQMKQIKI